MSCVQWHVFQIKIIRQTHLCYFDSFFINITLYLHVLLYCFNSKFGRFISRFLLAIFPSIFISILRCLYHFFFHHMHSEKMYSQQKVTLVEQFLLFALFSSSYLTNSIPFIVFISRHMALWAHRIQHNREKNNPLLS